MQPSRLSSAQRAGGPVMPLTWDRTPVPGTGDPDADTQIRTERTPTYDASDFGEGESERTQITTASPYELKSRFTGRSAALDQLQELIAKAFDHKTGAFAAVVGDPGMGKSRILAELIARTRTAYPTVAVLSGIADEN